MAWQSAAPDALPPARLPLRPQGVRYGEVVEVDGHELRARAFPTGAVMGGAAWVINDGCRW